LSSRQFPTRAAALIASHQARREIPTPDRYRLAQSRRRPSSRAMLCPSYHNTAQPPPSDSPTIFSGSLRFSEWSGEYGDVHFGLLPKTHKRLNGPPLSTGASLHARPWSKVDREARQISDPGEVTWEPRPPGRGHVSRSEPYSLASCSRVTYSERQQV